MTNRPDICDLKAFRKWLAQHPTYSDIVESLCHSPDQAMMPSTDDTSSTDRLAALMQTFEAIEETLAHHDN